MSDQLVPRVSIIMPARVSNADELAWMREAVNSVIAQTVKEWELVIVDDHSPLKKELATYRRTLKTESRIRWIKATGTGTIDARNQAAKEAAAELLLPVDADDKLEATGLEKLLAAWANRGDKGFVYGSTMRFGVDWTRILPAQPFCFPDVLKTITFTVTCLHLKSDWQRVGGWKTEMAGGLEDWEYAIALGELGVCGMAIPDVILWYRQTSTGRHAHLRQETEANGPKFGQLAYQKMRELHRETFNGRTPTMCGCTGKPLGVGQMRMTAAGGVEYQAPGEIVMVEYVGGRSGNFGVAGPRSKIRYTVPGKGNLVQQPNGAVGVDPRDVGFFLSLNRGQDFRVVK